MNDWHKFLKQFFKDKKEADPKYLYKNAMKDARNPYKQFKIERTKMRKEIGKKIHIIRDPLNYIMPQYLDTYDKIALKMSHILFSSVRLNNKDLKLLYLENKQKIRKEKDDKKFSGIIELRNHLRASRNLIRPLRPLNLGRLRQMRPLNLRRLRQNQPINHRRLRQILKGMI